MKLVEIVEIVEIVEETVSLLTSCGATNWITPFEEILQLLRENDYKQASRRVFSLFGGMGSFSDVVLYRNGEILVDENNQLESLRKALFEEAKRIIN